MNEPCTQCQTRETSKDTVKETAKSGITLDLLRK